MTQLLLASNSPRRRALFQLLDLPFEATVAEIDETPVPGEAPEEMVRRLSLAKARSAAEHVTGRVLVIGSDTTVALDGRILGKPSDAAEARRMLLLLRNRPHQVHTGVAIVDTGDGREISWSVGSVVWMRPYNEREIADYIASKDPFDKAGGYAIQHPYFRPVARIEGCYTNVMGMPLCELARGLADFGLPVEVDVLSVCTAFTGHPCRECSATRNKAE